MTGFNQWDVVVVPFPFVDTPKSKPRPSLVLSDNSFNRNGLVILSMITTQKQDGRYLDIPIENLESAGLQHPSIVRWKMFTLDSSIIRKKIGRLGSKDIQACTDALRSILTY